MAIPLRQAQVEMWHRRAELNFLLEVAGAFRNITGFFKDRETCVEAWGVVCAEKAPKALGMFDEQLAKPSFSRGSIQHRGHHHGRGAGFCPFGKSGRVAGDAEHQALAAGLNARPSFSAG